MRMRPWVAVIVAGLLVSGCTGSDSSGVRAPVGGTSSAVRTSPDPTVTVSGLPAGAKATVTDTGHGTDPTAELTLLSDTYDIGPTGPLSSTAHITVPLRTPVDPAKTAVVAATRESPTDAWEFLPVTLSADGRTASFDTSHFSIFGVLGYDLGNLISAFKTDFVDGFTSGATQTDVPKPSCSNEAAARADNYAISSSSTDTLYWCFGEDNSSHRILQVTNHRRYPLEVAHPNMAVVGHTPTPWDLTSISRAVSGAYTIISPGGSTSFNADLGEAGGSEGIQTEMDGLGQSLYALQTGIDTLLKILTRFGAGANTKTIDAFNTILGAPGCADAVVHKTGGDVISSCFDAEDLFKAFGAKAFLLTPIMAAGALVSFFHSEWNALIDQFNGHDKYQITITRTPPQVTLAAFAGQWYGHTRGLAITPPGVGTEDIGNGCCDPVIDLTFQLSNPRGTDPTHATATATITAVTLHHWDNAMGPAPHLGQVGTVTIQGGVLTDQLDQATYCTMAEDLKGTCGA